MNPFELSPKMVEDLMMDWNAIYPAPYMKNQVNPYTRTRVILMNGTEFEANWFLHQLSRHADDNDLRREVALIRRAEQQQQKLLSALKPLDETILEHTIGYEQLAVDLTAALAQREPDRHVKQALDFALLEDFDHLFRYADLLEMETGVRAEDLVGRYTEVMPGRPTISEHRSPRDSINHAIDSKTAELATQLCVGIITAAEQQTMNFYMNVNGTYATDIGRQLYQEIAMIEEQHVTQYGSLMDTKATWLENLLMHQYTECFLYYSCMETEPDARIKGIWAMLFDQEVAHLHKAADLLKRYEGTEWQQVIKTADFPAALSLNSNIEYVRNVLKTTVNLTQVRESYGDVSNIKDNFDFFTYQNTINGDVNKVPSHVVIDRYIRQKDRDYRFETSPNPIPDLQDRKTDNTAVGRTKVPELAGVR